MMFADVNHGISINLSQMFTANGYEVIQVYPSENEKTQISNKEAFIIPGDEKSIYELLSAFPDVSMIIWLWNLDAIIYEKNFQEHLATCHLLGIYSLLPCIKTIDQLGFSTRLWLITKGMVNVEQSQIHISQAHMLGFSRVMAYQEAVGKWCGYIDLDPEQSESELQILYAELTSADYKGQEEIAYRKGIRYINKLVPYKVPPIRVTAKYPRNKSYLITGGLGDLGFLAAQHLINCGAQHIILQIRHNLPDRKNWSQIDLSTDIGQKIQKIKTLEETGATLYIVTTDITQIDAIKKMANAHIKKGFPEIKGVIHCAGTVRDNLVYNMSRADIDYVFATKVNASWALHEAFDDQLDMFILFSSYAAVYGSSGQSNYAAANGFMDSLSAYRHQKNMSCLSINFGPWSDIGMAAKLNINHYFERIGIHLISPENGMKVFDMLFDIQESQIIVSPTDWSLIDKLYPSGRPAIFHDLILGQTENVASASEDQMPVNFSEQILNATDDKRNILLQNFLKKILSDVTGIDQQEIVLERRILDLGIDSLISVDLKNKIENTLPLKIKLLDLMKGPTLLELSNILERELVG